mgnify:CR=1 FL=1
MTPQVGNRVEVGRILSVYGYPVDKPNRETTKAVARGRVVWVGPKFVTVEFDVGYRECFGHDEVRVVGRAS